ncbi:hypothetical protein AVEN_85661-1 [Araneus ventricosus]|uniref:Uncharacterized protein n=1 Tax=Araneus ventricosus TaxID=182803 RepID=A0A4Y2WD52_ARAVE|nr:hypothetical protein AVEN_85661-1 [Araneus ventricosus]
MQSAQLSREHELRCRDLMILRYDRQRQLCDEIITKQRILIDALATGGKSKNANARRELNELYRIYQQEINDLNNGRNSDLGQLSLYDSLYRVSIAVNFLLTLLSRKRKNTIFSDYPTSKF